MSERQDSEGADLLAELSARIADLENLLRVIARGVGKDTDDLWDAVQELRDRLDQIDPQDPGHDQDPTAWVDRAGEQDWRDLAVWVDWFITTYYFRPDLTPISCWPAHLGLAEELAALRSAWRSAAASMARSDGDAMTAWHDRWMASLLARLPLIYASVACKDDHKTTNRTGRLTNAKLLDERCSGQPTPNGTP